MNDRIYKINELLKEEVGRILQKETLAESGVLTVTAVETTNDLRQATIWLSYFGETESEVTSLVEAKRKEIQKKINRRLSLKHVPRLTFRLDKSGEYSEYISKLIKEVDHADDR